LGGGLESPAPVIVTGYLHNSASGEIVNNAVGVKKKKL